MSCLCVEKDQQPKVIFILADDLGYGDLDQKVVVSCLSVSHLLPPAIDISEWIPDQGGALKCVVSAFFYC